MIKQRETPMQRPHRMLDQQLWVSSVGDIIIARLRGEPTEELLRACQEQVLYLAQLQGSLNVKVLYDTLEMSPPPAQLTFVQLDLDADVGAVHLRRAIVVPNSRLAFLARIAFGAGDYRVFYNDISGAVEWLNTETERTQLRMA